MYRKNGEHSRKFSAGMNFVFSLLLVFAALACSTSDPSITIDPNADGDKIDGDSNFETSSDGDSDAELSDSESAENGELETGDITELWLDDSLVDGEVRGGVIRRESELLSGVLADGMLEDFKLYNSHVAFVISKQGIGRQFSGSGGNIIDAIRFDKDGHPANDMLQEAFLMGGVLPSFLPLDGSIREIKADSVELVHNGSGGRAAQIRVTGIDAPLQFIDNWANNNSTLANPKIKLIVDYFLDADADYLRVKTTVMQENPSEQISPENFKPGLGILVSDAMQEFYPNISLSGKPDSSNSSQVFNYKPEHYALTHKQISYGFASADAQKIFALVHPYDVHLLMDQSDLVISGEESQSATVLFIVGDGSADSIAQTINKRRTSLEQAYAVETGKVTGTVNPDARYWNEDIEVLAIFTETILPDEEGGEATINKTIKAMTWMQPDNSFELNLPAGDYGFVARNAYNEYSEEFALTVVTGDENATASVSSPPPLAKASVAVYEGASDNFLPARVDFYHRPPKTGDTKGSPVIDADTELVKSVMLDGSGIVDVNLPFAGKSELNLFIVVSHGNLYTMQSKTITAFHADSLDLVFRLESLIDLTYEYGTSSKADGDVDSDTTELEDESSEPISNGTVYLHSVDLSVLSESSINSQLSMKTRIDNALAEGIEVIVATDEQTIADYSKVSGSTSTKPYVYNGMQVNPSWSSFSGIDLSQPEDRPAYYGVPMATYSDTGDYMGRRPAPSIWLDLSEDYKADFIQVNHPRKPQPDDGKSYSFFDYYGNSSQGFDNGYDSAVGISSLAFEARSTLDDWDTLEILNSDVDFIYTYQALQDWFSLLAQGIYKPITGNSGLKGLVGDNRGRMGSTYNLVYSTHETLDEQSSYELLSLIKKGQSVVTQGPVLKVSLEGKLPGQTLDVSEIADLESGRIPLDLHFSVQAADWIPVGKAFVCVDGKAMDTTQFNVPQISDPLRLETHMEFTVPRNDELVNGSNFRDAYVVVMVLANASSRLDPVYPGKAAFAISNPIFIEADGIKGEFKTPKDADNIVPDRESPYCISESFCSYVANFDNGRNIAINDMQCCKAYPELEYCASEEE